MRSEEGDGILVDAFFVPEWQLILLNKLSGQKQGHGAANPIVFESNARVKQYLQESQGTVPKIHSSDLYNTSIAYDGIFYLKLYRNVTRAVNPDQEPTRWLLQRGQFPYLPAFIGSIEWKDKKGCIVLGLLQEMVENHGDGDTYFQERINNYIERILATGKERAAAERAVGNAGGTPVFRRAVCGDPDPVGHPCGR